MSEEKATGEKPIETMRAHCPTCDGERVCEIHGHTYVPWVWEDRQGNSMEGGVDHYLLQCRGCETVFYLGDSWNSEEYDHYHDGSGEVQVEAIRKIITYPSPENISKPIWFDVLRRADEKLSNILDEMYVAYDNGAYILTSIGLRTALDRGAEVLGIDPAKTFVEKLAELKSGGWIGSTEHDILEVITDAGNAAAHRGWSPDAKAVAQLLYALEVFLQRAFVVGKGALAIKNAIPPKPKRQIAAKP